MRKVIKIAAALFAVMIAVSLLGSSYVFAATQQTIANREDSALYNNEGVPGEEGDVDVPIVPTKTVRSISVYTAPSKLTYLKGEALDLSGLIVKATYSDNSSGIVTGYAVSGFDPNVVGAQTVIITLNERTAAFQVTVYPVGDASGDFIVNGDDATLLLQYAAGWNVTIQPFAADANGDGQVNGDDATLMLQYAAGWNVTLGK